MANFNGIKNNLSTSRKINLANCKLADEFISFMENNELHTSIPYLKLHFDWSKIEAKINCTHTKP